MRNIFDQYSQPENRLTHALVCALAEDKKLIKSFIKWVTGKNLKTSNVEIVEQRLPGDPEITDEESDRGLPDAWIYTEDGWALLIESKVKATLHNDQLHRHFNTAKRRAFEDVTLLAIDTVEPKINLIGGVVFKKWSEIYEWLFNQKYSAWASKTVQYMEIAEAKWQKDEYLQEGTLTKFSGIPFNDKNPYNYLQAKRLIRLIMEELRKRKDLAEKIYMVPSGAGRGMITGNKTNGVWDRLPLIGAASEDKFTKHPHLTVSIEHDRVFVIVIVPHGIKPKFRQNILNLGFDEFNAVMKSTKDKLVDALQEATGSAPWVEVVQRHYPTRSSPPIVDAILQYDLRTAFNDARERSSVKSQSQWLETTYAVLANKKSNLQVAVGAIFPYQRCTILQTQQFVDYIAATWIACKPLIDVMLKGRN